MNILCFQPLEIQDLDCQLVFGQRAYAEVYQHFWPNEEEEYLQMSFSKKILGEAIRNLQAAVFIIPSKIKISVFLH